MRRSIIIFASILIITTCGFPFSNSLDNLSFPIEEKIKTKSHRLYSNNIPKSTIEISTLNQLQNINSDLNGNYILMSDIDASNTENWNQGKGFEPIGFYLPFNGSLNGNGHTISNLFINNTEVTYCGLFGILSISTSPISSQIKLIFVFKHHDHHLLSF